jgi:hypothetical protein
MASTVKYYRNKEKIHQSASNAKTAIGIVARILDEYIADDNKSKYYSVINQDHKSIIVFINHSNCINTLEFYNN